MLRALSCDPQPLVRASAASRLNDQDHIAARLAAGDGHDAVRRNALIRISDPLVKQRIAAERGAWTVQDLDHPVLGRPGAGSRDRPTRAHRSRREPLRSGSACGRRGESAAEASTAREAAARRGSGRCCRGRQAGAAGYGGLMPRPRLSCAGEASDLRAGRIASGVPVSPQPLTQGGDRSLRPQGVRPGCSGGLRPSGNGTQPCHHVVHVGADP